MSRSLEKRIAVLEAALKPRSKSPLQEILDAIAKDRKQFAPGNASASPEQIAKWRSDPDINALMQAMADGTA